MNPIEKFQAWLAEASAVESAENPTPTAFALATSGPDGEPSVRMMLLKDVDAQGFVFYTNFESRKCEDLRARPRASMCFYWAKPARQVRVTGGLVQVTNEEADAYFATRPRESQLGAWASRQSHPLPSREALEQRFQEFEARYRGSEVPRPPYWSGFRLKPERIEFWSGRPGRLHDREVFTLEAGGAGWRRELLAP